MIHKDAKTIEQWIHKQAKNKRLKRLKKDACTCNNTKLESSRNTSPNAIEYFKFLFCSQIKPILLM